MESVICLFFHQDNETWVTGTGYSKNQMDGWDWDLEKINS